ncbi:MAG: DUF4329 domain-containing protein [Gemmataceae bacterium]|nr:DUF4329 domain-containing protein [Gemmataceae bacterium]
MDAPSAAELEANPVVQAAFAAAWANSLIDDPQFRHEEGGYIYCDPATGDTGDVVVRRARPGGMLYLNLDSPPTVPGSYLVATYHTHAFPSALGHDPSPSSDDYEEADGSGVPWFVGTEAGVFVVGPDRRVGGLTGPPGYPI